jgi:hypothetical protein
VKYEEVDGENIVKATVTTSLTKNGETTTKEETFEGTEEEVMKKIDALKDDVKIEVKNKIIEVETEIN